MNDAATATVFEAARRVFGDPTLLAAVVFIVLVFGSMFLHSATRVWALGLLLAISALGPAVDFNDRWLRPPAPLDQMVLYSRVTTISLLMLFLVLSFYKALTGANWRVPMMGVALFMIHLTLCLRQFVGGDPSEGAVRLMVYGMVFVSMGWLLPSILPAAGSGVLVVRILVISALFYVLLSFGFVVLDFRRGEVQGRWFGMSPNPNMTAIVCALTLPATIGMTMLASTPKLARMVAFAVSGGLVVILLLTESRGGMLTAIVGVLFLFRLRLGKAMLVLIPLAIALYVALSYTGYEGQDFERFTSTQNTRSGVWAYMIATWLANPVFGDASEWRVLENAYLGMLMRTGLVGGAVMVVAAGLVTRELFRALRARPLMGGDAFVVDIGIAGVAALAVNCMFEATFFSNINQTIFVIYLYAMLLDGVGRLQVPVGGVQAVGWSGLGANSMMASAR